MKHRFNNFFFAFFIANFSAILWANPDVIFSDSAAYDGVFLKHELNGAKIKFLLSGKVAGISLPEEYFNADALVTFFQYDYAFTNKNLKSDFIHMMSMSIESKFSLKDFMMELVKALNDFKQLSIAQKSEGGCSTTKGTSSGLLFFTCLSFYLLRLNRRTQKIFEA